MLGAVVQMLEQALAIVVAEGLVEGLVVEGWLHEGVVQDGHGALGVAAMLHHLTWTVEVSVVPPGTKFPSLYHHRLIAVR
jgi:hypothetical protein